MEQGYYDPYGMAPYYYGGYYGYGGRGYRGRGKTEKSSPYGKIMWAL